MKLKFKAAVGSLLVTAVAAGAAMAPSAASAHGATGPLCYGNVAGGAFMWRYTGLLDGNGQWAVETNAVLYGEAFRIVTTEILSDGNFWSFGHSAYTSPTDYWVRTQHLRC